MKIAIAGYGNLGRGVESAVKQNPDMELCAVFTRRDPASVSIMTPDVSVLPMQSIAEYEGQFDVVVICGGSATDLPVMTPRIVKHFNVVDSFDTHARIPEHIANVHNAAKASGHTAIVSAGWDPGMFSLARVFAQACLPEGESYTFWGPGVSQGHSDAIRRIQGVLDARQYTIPVDAALEAVRSGENPVLTTRQKHTRDCYVVAQEGADLARIEREIKEMPNYFDEYDTTVTFITAQEMLEKHSAMMHGGFVIRSGQTALGDRHVIEYSLKLESNPQFTSSILTACARAAVRMCARGEDGCYTMPELRPVDLLPQSLDEIRAHMI
ncbi:MAG: diaminopimelate dehydrogenase [Clostridia bacterium]|nr:diaminopimelate dehydrogenase [Clostridia bacterium]